MNTPPTTNCSWNEFSSHNNQLPVSIEFPSYNQLPLKWISLPTINCRSNEFSSYNQQSLKWIPLRQPTAAPINSPSKINCRSIEFPSYNQLPLK